MARKHGILRLVCFVGLALGIMFIGAIAALYILHGNIGFFKATVSEGFYESLRECDILLSNPLTRDEANKNLGDLEKDARSIDSKLSLLKRRRILAYHEARFVPDYQESAQKAANTFTNSGAIAALASEALLMQEPNAETAANIRILAPRLHKSAFEPVMLFLYILINDMGNPAKALTIAHKEALWARDSLDNEIAANLLLLRIISGDRSVAQKVLDTLTFSTILKARFFYDYGEPQKSAQLLHQATDEESTVLHADALYLSGNIETARMLWKTLAADKISPLTKTRSLYNLAASASTANESLHFLEQLFTGYSFTDSKDYAIFAAIRYTRLLESEQALSILQDMETDPLIDLEIQRRLSEARSLDKSIAETWVLLDKYPNDERIYKWAAYFFDYQKRYTETAILEKRALMQGISGTWLDIHKALTLMREKRFDEAEELYSLVKEPIWQVPANIALIQEARRSTTAALMSYQRAAELVSDSEHAAILHLRISHCLRALNRESESRAALERSLELNPNYLSARVEMRRFNL